MSIGRLLLFVMTALAFVMAGAALTWGPPPLWVPVGFAATYFALIGWGVMNLRLGMFGDAICSVKGTSGAVALTFDDGPDPVGTRAALEALREANARATFFVVGKKAARHPEILREITAAGHELGVHSYEHQRLYSLLPPARVKEDIERTREVIFEATGLRPSWFRPPVGQMSPRTAAGAERAAAPVVGWSVRAFDGLKKTTAEDCLRRVTNQMEEGAIVLLHDAWEKDELSEGKKLEDCPAGVRALSGILKECTRRGIKPVTLTQLLESAQK